MQKEMINCSNCGKLIEKKGQRVMCIHCTNLASKIRAEQFRAEHREEIRERAKIRYKKKEGQV